MECDQFIIDSYSTLTAVKQAAQLELSYSWVMHRRGVLRKEGFLPEVRAYKPIWTDEENEYLRQNYPFYNMNRMEKHLGRSYWGIRQHAQKLGLLRVSEDYAALTLSGIFGCSCHTIIRLVKDGYLKGKQTYKLGAHRRWVFTEVDVVRFIRTYPWMLRMAAMQLSYFRSVLKAEWEQNPWYNPAQAAKRLGCSLETVYKRLASGEIKGLRRISQTRSWRYWWIREKDLRRFVCQVT